MGNALRRRRVRRVRDANDNRRIGAPLGPLNGRNPRRISPWTEETPASHDFAVSGRYPRCDRTRAPPDARSFAPDRPADRAGDPGRRRPAGRPDKDRIPRPGNRRYPSAGQEPRATLAKLTRLASAVIASVILSGRSGITEGPRRFLHSRKSRRPAPPIAGACVPAGSCSSPAVPLGAPTPRADR